MIQWNKKSIDDVTWEDNAVIRGQFPNFSLEDKALSEEGGNDRNVNEELGLDSPKPKVWRVYERKRGKRVTK